MKRFLTQSGFTLIELILAISIFVIISTLAVASFNTSGKKFDVRNKAQELVSLSRKLKTDAIASSKTCPDLAGVGPRTYYGTFLAVNFKSSDKLNTIRGHKYLQSPLCELPPDQTDLNEQYPSSLTMTATSIFPFGNPITSLYISQIDSIQQSGPSYSWGDVTGTRWVYIFYFSNGSITFFDGQAGSSNLLPPAKKWVTDALSNTTNVRIIPTTFDGVFFTLTDGQTSVRINFLRTGLVCTDEGPFTAPKVSCAGYNF